MRQGSGRGQHFNSAKKFVGGCGISEKKTKLKRPGRRAFFLKEEHILSKEEKIKKEKSRLQKIFKDLDRNKRETAASLISKAAFLTISLDELEEKINKNGYNSEYKNGENQFGTKQSPEVATYISMSKDHTTIISKLVDMVPPSARAKSKLAAMREVT